MILALFRSSVGIFASSCKILHCDISCLLNIKHHLLSTVWTLSMLYVQTTYEILYFLSSLCLVIQMFEICTLVIRLMLSLFRLFLWQMVQDHQNLVIQLAYCPIFIKSPVLRIDLNLIQRGKQVMCDDLIETWPS